MGQPFVADWPPDQAIVSLFREWIAAQVEAEALSEREAADGTPEQAAFEAECSRISDLIAAIAEIRSQGPIGLAVKAYLRHHADHGSPYHGRAETLREFTAECPPDDLERSMIEDAVAFVPELGPLAAAVVGSDKAAA